MRYLAAVETLAADLYRRAGEYPCTADRECVLAGATSCGADNYCLDAETNQRWFEPPPWSEAYEGGLARFAAARGRAVEALQRLARCENPLGIPEEDLPLYFGDVVGENSQFFASSDYLVESWARPAVGSAMSALEQARTAWLSKRDSEVRQLMNEYDAERRLEALQTSLVKPVIEACGITEYDIFDVLPAFAARDLTVGGCFRKPSCAEYEPECVRGTIGDAALGIKAAKTALRLEMRQQDRRHVEQRAQEDICERVTSSIVDDIADIAQYKDDAERARQKSKGVFGSIGGWVSEQSPDWLGDAFELLGGCLKGAVSGAATGAAAGGLGAEVGAAAGCGFGIDSTYAAQGHRDLDEARDAMNLALTTSQLLREQDACWDEVDRRLRDSEYGLDFGGQQLVALEQARYRLDELLRATTRNLEEARVIIDRERGRTLPSVAHHYWTDEKVDRFRREFDRARRLTYLAMRAVEYEFQQSLGLRSAILTAVHPYELEQIVNALDVERATRTINARRPAAGIEVLSLRTDIVGLQGLEAAGPGERTDSSTRRLQTIITSPEYAVWDEDHNYIGQGIPFNLRESGALRHRCAERLWRVSATIQGDLTSVEEPGTHVFVLKNSVFTSQWCSGLGDGNGYQQASTGHTTNLFRADGAPGDGETFQYTTALLFPWFNVQRSEFYRDEFSQGASEELAGRGLYGEYILLFPYNGMLEPSSSCVLGEDPSCADPFRDLGAVEDVLIRFDYYSVDDLSL
jgi:hypothetical protein